MNDDLEKLDKDCAGDDDDGFGEGGCESEGLIFHFESLDGHGSATPSRQFRRKKRRERHVGCIRSTHLEQRACICPSSRPSPSMQFLHCSARRLAQAKEVSKQEGK